MTTTLIRWTLVLGLVLNAARLHGQSTEEGPPQPTAPRSGMQLLPAGGFRYGAPLGASVYGGVVLGRNDPAGYAGPSLAAEAGQDGARVSLGVASVSLAGTYRVQLSVIRTWDSHGDVRADQTYVGPEIALGIVLGITIGHYWRVGEGEGEARVFAIGSFIGI